MPTDFYNIILNHAKQSPQHPAIIDNNQSLTYAELLDQVEKFADGLISLNLSPKSKLGIFCLNQKEYLIALLAALYKGIPIIPYNVLLDNENLQHITQNAEVDCLLINSLFIKPETIPFLNQFKHLILTQSIPEPNSITTQTYAFQSFVDNAESIPSKFFHQRDKDIPDLIMYTSGTTAKPKGVILNEEMFLKNLMGLETPLQFSKEDRAIMALPFFHSFGNIIALLILKAGGTLILLPQFQPKSILDAIQNHRATLLPLVPSIYSFLIQIQSRQPYDISSLKYCISGGAALPHALLKKVEELFSVTVLEGYGLTETSPVISVNTMAHGSVVGSVGPILPNLEVKIVDETGSVKPQGEVGEIWVKGETVMPGYWKLPKDTAQVLTEDGWFKTGDLGHFDEKGWLFISAGRKKDLIIRAGENISPLAIENVLMNQGEIVEAAVVGIPHERLGEQVIACVVLKDNSKLDNITLKRYCRENLPAFMVPDKFNFLEGLPKNAVGKVLKNQIREEFGEK